jgi:alpha,alpha-trehalase
MCLLKTPMRTERTVQEIRNASPYPPIRDYAAIGDCHGAALVSRDGGVDWCCLGRFDADPLFCRLLDANTGGFFSIHPACPYATERTYVGHTNILRTTFSTPQGTVVVTDFMPVGRRAHAGVHDYVTLDAPFWLVRMVEGRTGAVPLHIKYRPTINFARHMTRLTKTSQEVRADAGPTLASDVSLTVNGDIAEGEIVLRAGERQCLAVAAEPIGEVLLAERIPQLFAVTCAFWEEWAAYCRYQGPYRDAVLRSALALKLLTYAPSGAIVAAPTTSLPEEIGGERNWDYRYCWLRDATFTLYALAALGYSGEARQFAAFLQQSCLTTHPRVQIMYGIDGQSNLAEHALEHLDGYGDSRPVRVGNGAFMQQQLDVYGEVLDWALLYRSLGGRFSRSGQKFLASLGDFVTAHWQEPDCGIWEMRSAPQHHVHGKIMSWVAMDRLIRLFGETPHRLQSREALRLAVLTRGVNAERGHLQQAFDNPETDAALLLAPVVGFPLDRRTLERTVEEVERTLRQGDYVQRYMTEDGLKGSEGAFLICSFWLVDALLFIGREREARELYERLLSRANDVGLYAEEIDPDTHAFLGNFPQAFTHLAVIQCATHFALYDRGGAAALVGAHADRARLGVEATAGLRALWAAVKASGRIGRLWSSPASILPREWGQQSGRSHHGNFH